MDLIANVEMYYGAHYNATQRVFIRNFLQGCSAFLRQFIYEYVISHEVKRGILPLLPDFQEARKVAEAQQHALIDSLNGEARTLMSALSEMRQETKLRASLKEFECFISECQHKIEHSPELSEGSRDIYQKAISIAEDMICKINTQIARIQDLSDAERRVLQEKRKSAEKKLDEVIEKIEEISGERPSIALQREGLQDIHQFPPFPGTGYSLKEVKKRKNQEGK